MSRLVWCEWAWLGTDMPQGSVLVTIDDGRIVSVEPGAAPGVAERRPGLTLPGFANAHSHAFHRVLRGRTAGDSFWTWREEMYRLAARLDPDAYFRLARAVYSEMLLSGFTTVAEFHYLHHGPGGRPYRDANRFGRLLIAAARDAGIRMTLLDACYLHGGVGRALDVVQRRFGDGSVGAWKERVEELEAGDAVVGGAIHSVRACTPDEIAEVAAWASGRPLHAHVSEQPRENEDCLAAYGRTPTGVLADAGALGPSFTAVHATHVTPEDRALLGESRSTVCMCPTTERDLADGIGPARALSDAGAALSLGTDSNALIDAFDEARSLEMHERLASGSRGRFTTTELLAALTNHASLGWPDAGSIVPGARADLVTVATSSVRLAGAVPEYLPGSVLLAGSPADVTTVTVDGVDRVVDGRYTAGDVASEYAALLPRLAR